MKKQFRYILNTGFLAVFILLMVSCKDKLTFDKNNILLYENLTPKTEESWGVVHSSLWIPVKKTKGPFMYLGEHRYSGEIVKYYKNGNLEFEGSYESGIENGEWKYYYVNGAKKSILTEGNAYGKHYVKKEFYKNGKMKSHHIGNSYKDSTYYISYFKNGKMKYEHHFYRLDNEIERYQKRNSNGDIYELFNEDSIYYLKDSLKLTIIEHGYYKGRRRKGIWNTYAKTGNLLTSANYSDGELNGNYLEYYHSGAKKETGQYENNYKVGKWNRYYENGKIEALVNYKKGKLEGRYKEYYEKGMIRVHGTYYADEKDGVWKYYQENGKIERKESF